MESLLVRWMGRGREWRRGALFGTVLCALLLGAGSLAGDSGSVEAEEYSAYEDERKPVIHYLFSQDENVGAFQEDFGLDDAEVARALAATREEKEALEDEQAESERIVDGSEGLPPEKIEEEIAASDYEEEVEAAVAKTKSEIEALLAEDRRAEFAEWVDGRWEREQEEYYAERTIEGRSSRAFRCRTIHASWYRSSTERGNNYEVALPHKKLKFKGGFRVRVIHQGSSAKVPVKEVGPWNIRDNYWAKRKHRDRWRDLPRCKPQAEAAFFGDYNKGEDQYGRVVANPAGIDLTLKAAKRMGIRKKLKNKGILKVDVRFPWLRG